MGTVIRIPKKGRAEDIQKALDKLKKKNNKKSPKTIADFFMAIMQMLLMD